MTPIRSAALYRVAQLVYVMAPAYAANMAPPFVKYWPWWNRPISTRWLGAHKTVIGFVSGVLISIGVVCVQHRLRWSGWLVHDPPWLTLGVLFGIGAMGGDALKSAVKRRIGIPPGGRWVPVDQLDFVGGALALVWPFVDITGIDVAVVLVVSFAGHVAVDHVAYWVGIRDSKW